MSKALDKSVGVDFVSTGQMWLTNLDVVMAYQYVFLLKTKKRYLLSGNFLGRS
jgi:hypothetical protein